MTIAAPEGFRVMQPDPDNHARYLLQHVASGSQREIRIDEGTAEGVSRYVRLIAAPAMLRVLERAGR